MLAVCYSSKAQLQSEMIDKIIKIRSSYVVDSIPSQFRWWYEPFTYSGDKQFYDIYDTLKNVLPKTMFFKSPFYWLEYLADDRSSKTVILWTDSLMVHFNCRWIALWNRKKTFGDTVIYKLKIYSNLEKSLNDPFFNDFEEWNEFVTNRSYLYWDGTGGGFRFCTKVSFVSDCVEIQHTAFRDYEKKCPLFYLREQQEDDYNPRLQVNCNWITGDRLEKVVWGLIGGYKERGFKVFDCEGKEISFE